MSVTNRVVVVDVEMPFWSMVTFMVKWTVASIPAFLIVALLAFGVTFAVAVPLGLREELSAISEERTSAGRPSCPLGEFTWNAVARRLDQVYAAVR